MEETKGVKFVGGKFFTEYFLMVYRVLFKGLPSTFRIYYNYRVLRLYIPLARVVRVVKLPAGCQDPARRCRVRFRIVQPHDSLCRRKKSD